MNPSIGKILIYSLTDEDAEEINRRRTTPEEIEQAIVGTQWSKGAQAHIGNLATAGREFPMIVVNWLLNGNVNGQVMLDGTDTLWVTDVHQGFSWGTWRWPFEL